MHPLWPRQPRREGSPGDPRQLAAAVEASETIEAALDRFAPIGALLATASLIAIAAMTAMAASGCSIAEPCTADDDCFRGTSCINAQCVDRARRTIDIESSDEPPSIEGFAHVEELVIRAGKVAEDLEGFPALVTVVDQRLRHVDDDGFVRSRAGDDVAFFALDGDEALPREIAHYDPESGAFTAWVRLPRVFADSDTRIALAWGADVDALDFAAPLPIDRVWRDNYVAVWHLDDVVTASDGSQARVIDALGLAFGSAWSLTRDDVVPAVVGRGLRFTDPSAGIEVPAANMPAPVDVDGGITIEAWARADAPAGVRPLYRRGVADAPAELDMSVTDVRATFTVVGATAAVVVDDVAAFHHYAGVFGGGQQRLFVDGVVRWNAAPPVERLGADAPTWIGSNGRDATVPASFGGVLDEVRIAARPLSSAWIRAVADNARDPASFVVRAR